MCSMSGRSVLTLFFFVAKPWMVRNCLKGANSSIVSGSQVDNVDMLVHFTSRQQNQFSVCTNSVLCRWQVLDSIYVGSLGGSQPLVSFLWVGVSSYIVFPLAWFSSFFCSLWWLVFSFGMVEVSVFRWVVFIWCACSFDSLSGHCLVFCRDLL